MENIQHLINQSGDLLDKLSFFLSWFLILLWIWGIIWIAKDIQERTDSLLKEIIFILLFGILWPIWWLFYIALRPAWYKRDKNWWREAILAQVIQCPECWEFNPKENNYCLNCWTKLKIKCKECQREFPYDYEFCPYCWAPKID